MHIFKKFYTLFFVLFFLTTVSYGQSYVLKTIVLDAGHGGSKPGSIGKLHKEKDLALQVTLKVGKLLEAEMKDLKIIYTRKTDIDVDLFKRAEIANDAKADLFISIHCNSMPAKQSYVQGTETIVAGSHRLKEQDAAIRENADIKLEKNYKKNYGGYDPTDPATSIMLSLLKNAHRENSLKFASFVQQRYTQDLKRSNRGVKEQGLLVLQRCGMPAVLTEIGFISNPTEEKYIGSKEGQNDIARAIVDAIKAYRKEIEVK